MPPAAGTTASLECMAACLWLPAARRSRCRASGSFGEVSRGWLTWARLEAAKGLLLGCAGSQLVIRDFPALLSDAHFFFLYFLSSTKFTCAGIELIIRCKEQERKKKHDAGTRAYVLASPLAQRDGISLAGKPSGECSRPHPVRRCISGPEWKADGIGAGLRDICLSATWLAPGVVEDRFFFFPLSDGAIFQTPPGSAATR